VVLPDGEMEMRVVTVGLKDFVSAEIISGLEAGEVVSLGTDTTSDTSSAAPSDAPAPGPGGGMMRFLGGQ
jgi:hypothetical protein